MKLFKKKKNDSLEEKRLCEERLGRERTNARAEGAFVEASGCAGNGASETGKSEKKHGYFTLGEKLLWGISVFAIVVTYVAFGGNGTLTLIASLTGATSLIFSAKGNPVGQALMVVFSVLYGIISYAFAYYGEMITYLAMTAPMSLFSLIVWLKNPVEGRKNEVAARVLSRKECVFALFLSAAIAAGFYFILDYFHTANIFWSTVSVATSFIAVYFTFRRSPYYAAGYAANDVVLIVLWVLASRENAAYYSVVVCFCAFFVNDFYGFFCWRKMLARQTEQSKKPSND